MKKSNWNIYGTGRSMTDKQTALIENAAVEADGDAKKFFQKLAVLPKSSWRGMYVHYERGFKKAKKTKDWFSETAKF